MKNGKKGGNLRNGGEGEWMKRRRKRVKRRGGKMDEEMKERQVKGIN